MQKLTQLCLATLFTVHLASPTFADADYMDGFDYQTIHKEKAKPKVEKTYEKNRQKMEKKQRDVKSGIMIKPSNKSTLSGSQDLSKRYEIRERYTLDRSNKTPYSAFSVIDAMHQQMAKHCPKGWLKEGEWSIPVESDYFLYYQFKCL